MTTKERLDRIITICRLPSHSKDYLCDNPKGDGHCGDCDQTNIEVEQTIKEHPDNVLGIRRTNKSVTVLRKGGVSPIYLKIQSGIYLKQEPKLSPPKQP